MATLRVIVTWFNARRRLVAVALFGWSVLVVIGAGRAPDSDAWILLPDLGGLLIAAVGLLAMLGAVVVVYVRPTRKAGLGPRPTLSIRAMILVAIVFVLGAMLFDPVQPPEEEGPAEPESGLTAQQEQGGVADDPPGGAEDSDLVWLAVAGVVAGAVLWWSRRHSTAAAAGVGDRHDVLLDEDLGAAIDEATQLLEFGAEPRLAVLTAYASLERALAERGQYRDPAETSTEHVARVLTAIPVLAGPAVRLGRLYELARFSDHPITGEDQMGAAEALAQARRTLVTLAGDGQW